MKLWVDVAGAARAETLFGVPPIERLRRSAGKLGAGATIGGGSTIAKDAPPGQLTVARAKQVSLSGWTRPTKKR